jgi:undecaprenyl-diphosphatase
VLFGILAFGVLLPLMAVGVLAARREWRRLLIALVSSGIAMGLVALVEAELVRRFGAPELAFDIPSWVCTPDTSPTQMCVSGNATIHIYYMAGGVADFSSLAPWMSSKWRRFAWITIAVFAATRMLQGLPPPLDEFLVIFLAYAVGAGTLLAFGTPDRRPRGKQIVEALHRS